MCASRPCFGAQSQFSAATADVHGLQASFTTLGGWGSPYFCICDPDGLETKRDSCENGESTPRSTRKVYMSISWDRSPSRPFKKSSKIVKITRNYHFWRVRSIRNSTTQNGQATPQIYESKRHLGRELQRWPSPAAQTMHETRGACVQNSTQANKKFISP